MAERARLAEHLQESIGTKLRHLVAEAEALTQGLAEQPQFSTEAAELQTILQDAEQITRQLAAELTATDLAAGLQALAARAEAANCRVTCPSIPTSLPAPTAAGLLRIAQEAVENALRHSGATELELLCEPEGQRLCLQMRDNGRGFVPRPLSQRSLGLGLMQTYAASLGSDFRIHSQTHHGTSIQCLL